MKKRTRALVTGGHERELAGKRACPGASRQNSAGFTIALAKDLHRSVLADAPKNPFGIIGHG
jgi:hypothetical protein